jgi:hypothetical protein
MNRQTESQTHQGTAAAPLAASGILQRKCDCGQHTMAGASCDECNKNRLTLRRTTRGSEPDTKTSESVPSIVYEVLRSTGQPLDTATRAFMEPRFGHGFSGVPTRAAVQKATPREMRIGEADDTFEQEADQIADRVMQPSLSSATGESQPSRQSDFSQVRVHADERAQESARAVGALAYTVGQHVVFGAGQYAPATRAGRQLLAHELTHVLQQVPAPIIQRQPGGGGAPADHRFSAEGVSTVVRRGCAAATFGFAAVEDAARTTLDRIFNSECIETSRRTRIQRNLTKHGLDIRCALTNNLQTPGACAESTGFFIPANIFTLSSAASFPTPHPDRNAGCPALASTILHEIVHLTRGFAGESLPDSCENSCFGTARGTPDLCRDIDVTGKRVHNP